MTKKEKAFWLTVFLAAGLCLRMNNLGSRSLWTDEFYTLFQSAGHGIQMKDMLDGAGAQNSPRVFRAGELKEYFNPRAGDTLSGVGAALRYSDVHPPLYFWIIHLWTKIFGNSAFAVRFFSVLAGLFCILAAYQVTRYLFGEEAAIFSALFVSISPFCVRYSQEARSYMMVMALGLLAW
ncbi:MAG: glycosyltransferase family 39 protein, partial [Deltaproteobacteria bacterium]